MKRNDGQRDIIGDHDSILVVELIKNIRDIIIRAGNISSTIIRAIIIDQIFIAHINTAAIIAVIGAAHKNGCRVGNGEAHRGPVSSLSGLRLAHNVQSTWPI
ncbi:MAG: hypothetical protein ACR2PG_10340 [Hyphomicrobiaceae bacterium]